jgi:hypothetical protein
MIQVAKESLQQVYRQGIFTRALGRSCSSNPYPLDTSENVLWEKGWRLIDATREERALDQFARVLVSNYIPEKQPKPCAVDASAWLWRSAVALGSGAIVLWLTVYLSLLAKAL